MNSKGKKSNALIIAVAGLAVCMVCIVIALFFKSRSPVIDEGSTVSTSVTQAVIESLTTVLDLTPSETTTAAVTTTKQATITTKPAATSTAPAETTTEHNQLDDAVQAGANSGAAVPSNNADLPKDMSFAGLKKLGYNVIGGKAYIFNDDKNPDSVQKNLGYNVLYDKFAGLADFDIKTAKMKFTYGGKEWAIQVWKGQYISGDIGTVGGEVGIYTRKLGSISSIDHFDCAAEEDWLYLECTCFWDENQNGNYLPQYTRNYNKYWWATGYVDGQLSNVKNNNELRLLTRMTFKSPEMAKAFAQALSDKGFTQVSSFNPTVVDTYKISGKDVIFLWQNIR